MFSVWLGGRKGNGGQGPEAIARCPRYWKYLAEMGGKQKRFQKLRLWTNLTGENPMATKKSRSFRNLIEPGD